MSALAEIAPRFVEVAHRIVWCTVATTAPGGEPRTRILHPLWQWDDDAGTLVGWIATSPRSPKAAHLDAEPRLSLTYWDPAQDIATAECTATFEDAKRRWLWDAFTAAPAPVGYDPSIIPQWTSPDAEGFGALRLDPYRLRVQRVADLAAGGATTWRRG